MSEQNKSIVSVKDLKLSVKLDEGRTKEIEYGSFEVLPGDFVLIKGRNGSGKSTLLRMFRLQGVDYFDVRSGEIFFREEGFPDVSIHKYSAAELTHLNRAIAFIGQEERFLSSDSAYSYIYNACRIALEGKRGMTPAERRSRLLTVDGIIFDYYNKYLAKSFDCKKYKTFKNKSARAWSGGQQKMINVLAGIIKAKVADLSLIIMDEPLNNLDGMNKYILNKLVSELISSGVAVMAITHCQIFAGVNKVLSIEECDDGIRRATLKVSSEHAHEECLEAYDHIN